MLSRLHSCSSFSCRPSSAAKLCCRRHRHHQRTKLPTALFPAIRRVPWRSMASDGDRFPPQRQERQPGKEHAMDPTPQFSSPDHKPSNKLQGRVALVTPGSGELCATALCRKVPRSPTVVDEVVNAYGQIAILVNNAAEQYECSTVEEIDEARLERVFRTNIYSHFFMVRHALKRMKEGSSIISTASVNAYTSTKGAIVAFTRGLALQLVGKGIRVNGVAPGPIWTPLIPASFTEEETKNFGKQVPMKRAGQPIEVAPSFVFLACNQCSSYITGQVLHPNGECLASVLYMLYYCLSPFQVRTEDSRMIVYCVAFLASCGWNSRECMGIGNGKAVYILHFFCFVGLCFVYK